MSVPACRRCGTLNGMNKLSRNFVLTSFVLLLAVVAVAAPQLPEIDRDSVERVTFWGLHDGMSWKTNFPVRGRTNYPLLFDREMKPKLAYDRLMDLARKEV